jgi:hypothetical protein
MQSGTARRSQSIGLFAATPRALALWQPDWIDGPSQTSEMGALLDTGASANRRCQRDR